MRCSVLEPGASVVVSSTVPPSAALEISQRLLELPNKPLMVDAPVSGGAARAANGDLTIMASGDQSAMVKAGLVLDACTKQGESYLPVPQDRQWLITRPSSAGGSKDKRLFIFDGGAKFGSFVKARCAPALSFPTCRANPVCATIFFFQLAHQNLAGVHVAASAEAMAFAAKLNLPLRKVYARVIESRGFSWMYRNRAFSFWTLILRRIVSNSSSCALPGQVRTIEGDATVLSAVDILVKDIVRAPSNSSSRRRKC